MYKRPTIVRKPGVSMCTPIPLDTPGVLGDVARAMARPGPAPPPPKKWVPPVDHESYFEALKRRGENTEHLEKLTEEYYKNIPPKPAPPPPPPPINIEPMLELQKKYGAKAPPLQAKVRAMREAGYPEEKVERFIKWHKKMEDTYEERTEKVEKIFSKWPSAASKKRKVIKAVKKKM